MNSKSPTQCAFLLLTVLIISCNGKNTGDTKHLSDIEKWKLGWRVINASWDKNYHLGEQQFDSLLELNEHIEAKFLATGLDILAELGKYEKIDEILNKQELPTLEEVCNMELLRHRNRRIQKCQSVIKEEIVENRDLQIELIKMYINDQSVRGNVMNDLIANYGLGESELSKDNAISVDKKNRDRLKEIISEFGFPTRKLVGKDAMQGVFMMIQHSDGDKAWQKAQLPNIKNAVKQGDIEGQNYAYLYDRIKINGGERQLYGTQFKYVDAINQTVELADTEDIENLDRRRMEFGMMPMQMYEQFVLKNVTE